MKPQIWLAASVLTAQAATGTVLSLNMSTLPSAQGWTYAATGASHGAQVEPAIWSANGTTLSMNTIGSTLVSPSGNLYLQTGIVNTTDPIMISWRSRVLQVDGVIPYGWAVGVTSGVQQFSVGFRTNAIQLESGTPVTFDATAFHDYRIEATPGAATYSLFVDNVPFASGTPSNVALNRLFFGDATGAANSRAEMTSYAFSQVPEPSRMTLLLLGALCLFARRRRHADI